jgi:hypothetical protein
MVRLLKMKLSNISHSQLSIERLYGGCIINGKEYVYNPQTDELVLKQPNKLKKKSILVIKLKFSYEQFKRSNYKH